MKHVLYLLFLATALAQGAASSFQSNDSNSGDEDKAFYKKLKMASARRSVTRLIISVVQGDMVKETEKLSRDVVTSSVKMLKDETVPFCRSIAQAGEIRHECVERPLASTSLGNFYLKWAMYGLHDSPYMSSSTIEKGMRLFLRTIFKPSNMEKLDALDKFCKPFRVHLYPPLSYNGKAKPSVAEQIKAWQKFNHDFEADLLSELNILIPGIQLKPTIYETVKANAYMQLTAKQEIDYTIAQIAIGYNLGLLGKISRSAFNEHASCLRAESMQKASGDTAKYLCSGIIPNDTPRAEQATSSCTSSTDHYDY